MEYSDLAFAVCDTFPELLPGQISSSVPPIVTTLRAITLPCSAYPQARLEAIQDSLAILHEKSKSFSTASMLFEGRLRLQLLSLSVNFLVLTCVRLILTSLIDTQYVE